MFKKIFALVFCLALVITAVGCGEVSTSNTDTDTSSVTSKTESTIKEKMGIYGTWESEEDISGRIPMMLLAAFRESSTVKPETAIAVYTMQFTENGKYLSGMRGAETFYNSLVKAAEEHIRSNTADENAIKEKLETFKMNYSVEKLRESLEFKSEGTYVLNGDPYTTGTVEIDVNQNKSVWKFTVEGDLLTIVEMKDGEEIANQKYVYTRK